MEAIILAGGKGERLGAAAQGLPKALVSVAGRPLAAYQVGLLAGAGVTRVIVSCRAGTGHHFEEGLAGSGVEVVLAEEPEPLGRGGGIRFAAQSRTSSGDAFVLNGDELLTPDLDQMLAEHRRVEAAATLLVAPLKSAVGIVEVADDDRITSFREAPVLPHWVSAGVYVLSEDAFALLPERGDHETSTFPQLAAEGRLRAHRYKGVWLTVNTPKDLRRAEAEVGQLGLIPG
jgi:NDP-sugar pyrophosphorylase family protein